MAETFRELSEEFLRTVIATYTFYLDGFKGLEMVREDIEQRQKASGFDDSAQVPYLRYHEGETELTGLVQVRVKDFKANNSEDGQNFQLLGNLCVVALFSWWEDHYRQHFADYLGKAKNEIEIPILGDIRLLRNGIVHSRGRATEEINRCEVVKWFKPGERILITFEKMEHLGIELKKGIEVFYHQSLMLRSS